MSLWDKDDKGGGLMNGTRALILVRDPRELPPSLLLPHEGEHSEKMTI